MASTSLTQPTALPSTYRACFYDKYPPRCNVLSLAGFIDFIVAPTMTVLGDVLEAIFRSLEAANRTPGESGPPTSDHKSTAKKLKRPWVDQLGLNKAKWAAKNDAGACA